MQANRIHVVVSIVSCTYQQPWIKAHVNAAAAAAVGLPWSHC